MGAPRMVEIDGGRMDFESKRPRPAEPKGPARRSMVTHLTRRSEERPTCPSLENALPVTSNSKHKRGRAAHEELSNKPLFAWRQCRDSSACCRKQPLWGPGRASEAKGAPTERPDTGTGPE
ncbi:unnamed protein product [Pleuronectes platessa]|uniref:Uncharacterized protein n=1 Tax=Pleuronectes platessa TaxID=8262 RepID=A0A9N7YIU8_PLEPL|nr:unnamed protein product [Pleuronectes platessa]